MKKWFVKLNAVDKDVEVVHLGRGVFWANSAEDAKECAMQAWWGLHFEEEGLTPIFTVREILSGGVA